MISSKSIVKEARKLVGTPFVHQARLPGIGIDCAGVIAVVAISAGLAAAWMDRTDYQHLPSAEEVTERLELFCYKSESLEPVAGSILVFNFAGEARHMGWCTGDSVVHAYSPSGRVVEHRLEGRWAERLHSVWLPKELKLG